MTKKMTPEAKERLRAAAEAKKGRTTLMGLERTLGLVAFDWVDDRINDGLLPTVTVNRSGLLIVGGAAAGVQIVYWHSAEQKHNRTPICWCRLKRCPQWITDEFANRWGSRRIQIWNYAGPGIGQQSQSVPVVPLAQAVEWLRFLWPKDPKKVPLYVAGYTDKYVERHTLEGH